MSLERLITKNLADLGLTLPPVAAVKGNYLPYTITGNLVYLSGTLPIDEGKVAFTGAVGDVQTVETGYESAKLCALNALAILAEATENFTTLKRIVSLGGFVNSINGFQDSPKVINGASDFLVAALGDAGRHVRVAVSTNGLPLGATTETQIIAELA